MLGNDLASRRKITTRYSILGNDGLSKKQAQQNGCNNLAWSHVQMLAKNLITDDGRL